MDDRTRFKIEIYCEGVITSANIRGKRKYLLERAFLDELTGHPHPSQFPVRPVPDPNHDIYMLDRNQAAAYSSFRRDVRKTFDKMATRKFQARSNRGADETIPLEFQAFGVSLVMGMKYAGSTPKKWVGYAVSSISRESSEAALRFLDRLADGNYDAARLQQLWEGWLSDFGLWFDGDLRTFLLGVRSEMAKLIKPTVNRRHSRR